MFRLRSNHCLLNQYRFKINKHPTGCCDMRDVSETVYHYFFDCVDYMDEKVLLGEKLRELNLPYNVKSLLINVKMIKPLFMFIKSTGSMSNL